MKTRWWFPALAVGMAVALALFFAGPVTANPGTDAPVPDAKITLTSTAFAEGGLIPAQYTCHGTDISPPLAWTAGPAATKSYVILVHDPDAPGGSFSHWVIYNIPKTAGTLGAGVPTVKILPDNSRQGKNSFGTIGYAGPCPPAQHHYYFKIYALDKKLSFTKAPTRAKVLAAMTGHILAKGSLMGRFG